MVVPRPFSDLCLTDAYFAQLPNYQRGKVRDSYDLSDGRRLMIATDRQSAFDQVLAAVPYKGQILNQTSRFWFNETAAICPNHVINYPDPNAIVAKNLSMLPIEMVVRDYITGSTETSIWPMYDRGERVLYGNLFPEDLKKNEKLPKTILTPTTKAEHGDHDLPITPAEILSQGLLTQEQWVELARLSLAIFDRGREISAKNGLILVDTKYEFGLDEDGKITLADEVHTPDSSRFWHAGSYAELFAKGVEPESLDKEFLRLWISARCDPYNDPIPKIPEHTLTEFSNKYIALYELVTGHKFRYPTTDQTVQDRLRINVTREFPEYF